MICDYCQRPVVTDSQGRCRNCGAPHAPVLDPELALQPITPTGTQMDTSLLGAMLGGGLGFAMAMRMFKD